MTSKHEIAITIATLIGIVVMITLIGYNLGKSSPCQTVQSIDIKPIP